MELGREEQAREEVRKYLEVRPKDTVTTIRKEWKKSAKYNAPFVDRVPRNLRKAGLPE